VSLRVIDSQQRVRAELGLRPDDDQARLRYFDIEGIEEPHGRPQAGVQTGIRRYDAGPMSRQGDNSRRPTPLPAIHALTFMASIGTGVIWNGVPFIAKHEFLFPESRTLQLYVVIGVIYVVGALAAGPVVRRAERVLSARSVLGLILLLQAVVCILPLVFTPERDPKGWSLWVVAAATSALSSFLWPIVESYITSGRHGGDMRSAIGWWNVTWTTAVAAGVIGMAPLMEAGNPRLAIVGLGAFNVMALLALRWFQPWPGDHDESMSLAAITSEYPLLLRAARVLLPLSYLLVGSLSPLMPYLLDRVQVGVKWETPATATWMLVRVVAIALMWRMAFWHGRWGTLLLGAMAMTGGFAAVVLAPNLLIMLIGLAVFGAGMAIIYYAALYYAMSVGRGAVDAGGTHEALIGAGYAIGPLASLIGAELGGPQAIVTMVWLLLFIGAIPAIRPYLAARRLR
jgi:hypothetical protein